MKRHKLIGYIAYFVGLATLSHAQAIPTASRGGTIQVGVGGTFISPDYAQRYIKGISVYGGVDFLHHLGVEGDVHISAITPTDIAENTYLIGPRYRLDYGRFHPYAKALVGIGTFQYQQGSLGHGYANGGTFKYFVYGVGGGLDIKATEHINVRAIDLEYQEWPGYATSGLTPVVTTIGVAYVFR
ncbi:MAG: porin family protein [Acidobacteriota bacterium]|nr:porin family protein [Acidobacteriota bacterium]